MRRTPLSAALLAGLAAIATAGALVISGCGDDGADLPDNAVARVGDAIITEAQLDRAIARNRAQAEAQGQTLPAEGEEGYEQIRRQALDLLWQQKVIGFEARKCGTPCRVTDEDVTEELARIRRTNFEGSQKRLDEFLKEQGISKSEARQLVRQDLQRQELEAHVTRGVRFGSADAREYYEENPDQFRIKAGRTARHILVETKAEADRIRAQVTLENFGDLAREHSIDPGSGQQGGELGAFQRGTFVPAFEKVAFELEEGKISQPVKTQFGWHIITVEITPPRTIPFADARSGILSSQLAQRRQAEFSEWSEEVLGMWRERTVYADEGLKPLEEPEAPEGETDGEAPEDVAP